MEKNKPIIRSSRRQFLLTGGAITVGAVLPTLASAKEDNKLLFYNWDTYIGETTLADFKKSSDISVTMDLFADNSELFAKMREGNVGYDVIVPTNDYVDRMRRAGLLMPLNHSKIPNFRRNIDLAFQDADFDPHRRYSMPYMWGTMGIAYRKSAVKKPTSWLTVWGEQSNQYKNRIAWISEPDSMIGMVMKSLGHSYNSKDSNHIQQAANQLIKYKKNVRAISDDNGQDLLATGEVDLAVEWNGDIAQLYTEDEDIGYVIPKEGSYYWQDCLAIPVGAKHPENAHRFINFLLDEKIGRDLAQYIEYATPNRAARELMSSAYKNNNIIFPSEAEFKTLEPSLYLGEARADLIEKEWTRVLSS